MPPLRIKICGLTNAADALLACRCGADVLGFVFADSPRRVVPETVRDILACLPPFVRACGVFLDHPADFVARTAELCGLDVIQLHGSENDAYLSSLRPRLASCVKVVKAFGVNDKIPVFASGCGPDAFLLDSVSGSRRGGTGIPVDWDAAARWIAASPLPVVLAGGLTPENVGAALRVCRPYAVDASSGLESAPGVKDAEKLSRFIAAVRAAQE